MIAEILLNLLQLNSTNCTPQQARRNFRTLMLKIHPDRCSHPRTNFVSSMVISAYDILKDCNKFDYLLRHGHLPDYQTLDLAQAKMALMILKSIIAEPTQQSSAYSEIVEWELLL